MAGNPRLKVTTKKERIHIYLPRYLAEAVTKSAETTNRGFSEMLTDILQRTYGRDDPYKYKIKTETE